MSGAGGDPAVTQLDSVPDGEFPLALVQRLARDLSIPEASCSSMGKGFLDMVLTQRATCEIDQEEGVPGGGTSNTDGTQCSGSAGESRRRGWLLREGVLVSFAAGESRKLRVGSISRAFSWSMDLSPVGTNCRWKKEQRTYKKQAPKPQTPKPLNPKPKELKNKLLTKP